jgi:hypothetical protein
MKMRTRWVVTGVLAALVVAGTAMFQVAVRQLRAGVEQALGPRASVGAVEVGWNGIELRDLKVRSAPKGWPAQDELRAARVKVVPELASVFGDVWRVRSVTIDDAYVSVLRSREGKLKVVPALLEGHLAPRPDPTAAPAPQVRIGRVLLAGAAIEFFDASVRQPAHRMRLADMRAELEDISLPALDRPIHIDLRAVFKGPKRDGAIGISGRMTPSTHDAKLSAHLGGVDLISLEPYLLKVNEAGVRRGSLDLEIDATVVKNRLNAPGKLTLTDLELGSSGGVLGTFAGMPRQAVIASLSRNGRIELQFTLDGRLDDPKFSLNEAIAMRAAAGMAEALGVSVGGVVEGVGNMFKGLLGR